MEFRAFHGNPSFHNFTPHHLLSGGCVSSVCVHFDVIVALLSLPLMVADDNDGTESKIIKPERAREKEE